MAFAAFVKHCAAPSGEIIYLPGGSFLLPMLVKTDDGHRCDLRDWYRIKYDHIGRQASVRLLRDIERVLRSESMMWAELRCCSRELRESFQPAMPTDTFRCWMSDVMRLSSFASQTLQNRLLERLVERPDYERELIDMIPDFVLRRAELELVKNVESELLTESSAEGED